MSNFRLFIKLSEETYLDEDGFALLAQYEGLDDRGREILSWAESSGPYKTDECDLLVSGVVSGIEGRPPTTLTLTELFARAVDPDTLRAISQTRSYRREYAEMAIADEEERHEWANGPEECAMPVPSHHWKKEGF